MKSFPIMFKRTISQYNLDKSYTDLLGLGIITVVENLKCDGQYPKSIQALVMFISLNIQSLSLIMNLIVWIDIWDVQSSTNVKMLINRCFNVSNYIMTIVENLKWDGQYSKSIQVLAISISLDIQSLFLIMNLIWLQISLLGPRVDELLHFSIASINSCLEREFHSFIDLLGILSRTWISISHVWAELKELYRTIQRSSSSIYRRPSYWIASITGSFHFLTQFISSHRPYFLFAILSLKKRHFVFLTVLLKLHQFSRLWNSWYLSRDSWYLLFHHALECLVIFTGFKFLCHE